MVPFGCSYCGREGSAPIDVLIARIGSSLPYEWGNADDEGVGWEGGYVGKTYDTYDLITEADDPPLNHPELIADIVRALPQQEWAQRDFYSLTLDQRMRRSLSERPTSSLGAEACFTERLPSSSHRRRSYSTHR